MAGLTIREAYVEASSFLEAHQVRDAASCAELLLQHVLGCSRSELLLRWRELFSVEQLELLRQLLARKAAGEPVQYITGEQEFYGLPFKVTPAVLIPRPETELLVEQIVLIGRLLWPEGRSAEGGGAAAVRSLAARAAEPEGRSADGITGGDAAAEGVQAAQLEARSAEGVLDRGKGASAAAGDWGRTASAPLIADIGAGSGAIAVSLAVQCPSWRIMSSDISPAALAVAAANAERHGVGGQVAFLEGDLLAPYIERGLRLDAVVSNPPYIPEADEAGLQPEVRLHEPRTALYGGADGLDLYRRLAVQLKELPALPSLVGLEVGYGQADEVAKLLREAADWDEVRIVPDLAGIDRHVIGIRYPG
ncbi:N5-glutamine methyltransferase family protein [Paenibacillus piri]|uniref:Release factor glutamine methyltransferase n=1 Tax=Paenibacillus piri TaxID=2547395 RepID=A0A4V2ZSK7_9BACL|nr:HemK/PrmC family methyltransferase [Paenibacillus piri]TDF93564.1 peptide chain release factor N(5)-glutamine methyltransferase [Paenibacillus piri]